MICPNCKTELVEVNGRFICSDCGREIPENEVMASDWGNGGTVRAGLYGAGTDEPEESNQPVAEYNTSLTESEGELDPQVTNVVPEVEVAESADEPTVEEVLQSQQPSEPVVSEAEVSTPVPDTGFYTANEVATPTDPVSDIPTPPPVAPNVSSVIPPVTEESLSNITETSVPEAVEPTPTEQVPASPAPEIIPEVVPEHTEVVKDMFENTATAVAPDPGIYTDPMYDTVVDTGQAQGTQTSSASVTMTTDKKLNLIIIIVGSVLTLLLIVGGVWGYLSLNKEANPVTPIVTEEQTVWQELQSVDGGFKISFPDQPDASSVTKLLNGNETQLNSYTYLTDDIVYTAEYAIVSATKMQEITKDVQTSLPKLVKELATDMNLVVADSKIGKYYSANSTDFSLTSDTAKYQGKIILKGNNYILIFAGSASGQSVDYDKFIKSFSFITESVE